MSATTELLIIEDLFLLIGDDESGKTAGSTLAEEPALAGALLLDLAEQGLVKADGKELLPDGDAPSHPLLAKALAVLTESDKPRDAGHWVSRLPRAPKPFERKVGGSLVERGVLTEEQGKMLSLFKATRWPERDPGPARQLRAGLTDVLARGGTARPRAEEISSEAKDGKLVSAAAAVSASVSATQTAVLLAVMTPVIVTTVTS